MEAPRNYLKLICKYELYTLSNIKVSAAKDHGENNIKLTPSLIHHLLRNRLSFYAIASSNGLALQLNGQIVCKVFLGDLATVI